MPGYNERLTHFAREESGAVTVDWVVLTAAIVSLGTLVVAALSGGMGQVSSRAADHVSNLSISTSM